MTETQFSKKKNKNNTTTKMLYGIVIALIVGIIAVGVYIVFARLMINDNTQVKPFDVVGAEDFDGSTAIDPPLEMPDFTLTKRFTWEICIAHIRLYTLSRCVPVDAE